ncbi:hypothetical protein SAMN04488498_12445 [Mesorhizobium albiziae]|uniref:Autotransporter domain-containing protein n=1 Tax=Neomesorhizobium albiziae TaxID=335020 RepID=A0A1I4EBK5_9HYPH|nr:autotransporter [Mesorhizobium albiziae]GLS31138.1 outer membrane autotransporter barrel domain protein [Mesorhizobium albiziae]SFL02653.1 hypothetical protein SAMN04488498_12445 [Mesorhizobium albiziae]
MTGKTRALYLGGASALAIGAASIFIPGQAEAACEATPIFEGETVVSVDVTCDDTAPTITAPFDTSFDDIYLGGGPDTLNMSGGSIEAGVAGTATPPVDGFEENLNPSPNIDMLGGNDTVVISGGTIGTGGTTGTPIDVNLGAGDDRFEMSGGTLFGNVFGEVEGEAPGIDTFVISGGTVTGSLFGLGGGNIYDISGGLVQGSLFAGSQNDRVTISGTANIQVNTAVGPDSVGLEDGDDVFTMTGGTLGGSVSGNAGNDLLTISGGTIGNYVAGNEGDDQIEISGGSIADDVRGNEGVDQVTISGGTIGGDVEGETVRLYGGTIGGDITGISGNTLIINGSVVANPLTLRNGVLFSGTGGVATITDEDLAAGGTKTQNFTGFNTVSASNSTLGFGTGTQGIGLLSLTNASTLFVNGNANLAGNLNLTNSTINMIDGAADDVFTLGGLTLNSGTIGLDLNQQTSQADQLIASAFAANGVNTILVNLVGTPQFATTTDIPIIISTNGPVAGTFVIQGIPGTVGSLFIFQVIPGPTGGLLIRAIPANFGIAVAPNSAVNASTVETAIDALYGVNRDAIASDLGLANGVQRVQLTSTFGVFASGQFAHTEHDGFTISGNGLTAPGPDFDADDFSAAISLDFNAAKHFGFDDRYGLNLGLFGGYASTDVGMGSLQGFDFIGDADNKSGMFGGYALFRQGVNYGLVSASTFIGETDVTSGVLNTTGSYDTIGYAVTGSIGHIFALSDRMRFDLRGGMLGVSFTGDDYTDSGGNQFGKSRISFGAFKFEPGIYADYAMENGMVFSPYARADLQQRFAYKNTATIDNREIDFDDADFSVALSAGFNLKMSERSTLSSELRGKFSSDSSTVGGKLGLKISF